MTKHLVCRDATLSVLVAGEWVNVGTVGRVKTMSGDVHCGDVTGDVSTMSGDVTCGSIAGSAQTMSGDITGVGK